MVPAVMVRSTPSTARKPRKSLVSPDVCSSGTADFRGPCTGSTPSIQPSLTCEPQKSAGHTWWLCERLTDHDMEELKTPPCASEPHQIAIINNVAVVHTLFGQSLSSTPAELSVSSPAQSDFSGPTS